MKRLEVYEIRGVAFGSLWLFLGVVARLTFQFIASNCKEGPLGRKVDQASFRLR